MARFEAHFPDLEEDVQDIVAGGDTVATRWVVTGTVQQEFIGIPATGQTIRVEGMNFYRLENGRVTDIWASCNNSVPSPPDAPVDGKEGVDGSSLV